MKKATLGLSIMFLGLSLWAQENKTKSIELGTITYQEKMKLEIKADNIPEEIATQFPKERIESKELLFTNEATLYQNDTKAKEKENEDIQSGNVMIRMDAPSTDNKVFTDLKNKKITEKQDFMGKIFLISRDQVNMSWKIGSEEKTILGYNCQKAVLKKDSIEIVAWFTPLIPVSSGPMGYGGLPGLILQLNTNKGEMVITATGIKDEEPNPSQLVKPKDGKKVTGEEFQKIVNAKMKEMRKEYGDSGNVIIKMEH